MMHKGIVVQIKDHYAIILTSDNSYVRLKLKGKMTIGSQIIFTSSDYYQPAKIRGGLFMNIKKLAIATTAIALLAIGFTTYKLNSTPSTIQETVATIIAIDINPSFQLLVDQDNLVLEVKQLNDDAKTIEVTNLIGLDAQAALEYIVQQAEEKGFIVTNDLEDDYVLVTAIDAQDDDDIDNIDLILTDLVEQTATSETMQKVNLALTKATKTQLQEATAQQTPIALYALGYQESVKEFFKEEAKTEQFKANGLIINQSAENNLKNMNEYVNEFKDEQYKEQLKTTFAQVKDDYLTAKDLYNQTQKAYQEVKDAESEEEQQLAEQYLLQLSEYKNLMESYQQQIDDVKDVLKEAQKENSSQNLGSVISEIANKNQELKGKLTEETKSNSADHRNDTETNATDHRQDQNTAASDNRQDQSLENNNLDENQNEEQEQNEETKQNEEKNQVEEANQNQVQGNSNN